MTLLMKMILCLGVLLTLNACNDKDTYIKSMIDSDSNNKMTLLERYEKACNSSNGAACAWLGYFYRYG